MKAVLCTDYDALLAAGPGGYFIQPDRASMFINLPGDTIPSVLRLGGDIHPRWLLSGPDDCPSLTPSINAPGQWHGYLTNGVLVGC